MDKRTSRIDHVIVTRTTRSLERMDAALKDVDTELRQMHIALEEIQRNPFEAQKPLHAVTQHMEAIDNLHATIGGALLVALRTEHIDTLTQWLHDVQTRFPSIMAHEEKDITRSPQDILAEKAHVSTDTIDSRSDSEPESSSKATIVQPANLDQFDLEDLFRTPRGFEDQKLPRYVITDEQIKWVQRHLREVGTPPTQLRSLQDAKTTVGLAQKLCDDSSLNIIAKLPKNWHWHLTSYIIAYLRHVQAALDAMSDDPWESVRQMEDCVRRMIRFSNDTQPGAINGFKRDSTPDVGGSWYATMCARKDDIDDMLQEQKAEKLEPSQAEQTDVLRRLNEAVDRADVNDQEVLALVREAIELDVPPVHQRMVNALRDQLELLREHPDLKDVADAVEEDIKQAQDAADQQALKEQVPPVPEALRSRTRGKSVALIGGARKADAELRITEAFAFDSLEWVPTKSGHHGHMDAFKSRMKNGQYDYVIAIENLVGHAWSKLIFKHAPEQTVPMMSSGYGIGALCNAFERFDGTSNANA